VLEIRCIACVCSSLLTGVQRGRKDTLALGWSDGAEEREESLLEEG
jgi:hypothetical protein